MSKNATAKFSLEELAMELGRKPSVVSRLVERGELPVKVKGDKLAISYEDLAAVREKFDSDRNEMLDAFKNKETLRRRAIDELSTDIDYDYNPKTDRIFL